VAVVDCSFTEVLLYFYFPSWICVNYRPLSFSLEDEVDLLLVTREPGLCNPFPRDVGALRHPPQSLERPNLFFFFFFFRALRESVLREGERESLFSVAGIPSFDQVFLVTSPGNRVILRMDSRLFVDSTFF